MKQNISKHTMPNGIRLLHMPSNSSVVYCGFVVNAGSRDELANEFGVAHFVEHMIFKGTAKRNNTQIISYLESVGGQIDAYTTKEETYIYAAVPSKYTERAMALLADIVFNANFPENELEHEREVIVEEIQSYNDTPSDLIFDEFENLLFSNSQLGHSILGSENELMKYNVSTLKNFVKRCYTTDNILFFLSGEIDETRFVRLADKHFNVTATKRNFQRQQPRQYQPQQLRQSRDTYQIHCSIGNKAYSMIDDKRTTLLLLNNILGGPNMSSRLNMAIRERNGLAYTIESIYTPYTDTGSWNIYLGCDEHNEKRAVKLIGNELEKLQDKLLSPKQLQVAKQQMAGQMLIADENRENLIHAIAKAVLQTNRCLSDAEILERINAITAEQLRDVACDIFDKNQLTKLIYY